MNNETMIERLERQNEAIDNIKQRSGRELAEIDIIRIQNKQTIEELKGNEAIALNSTDYDPAETLIAAGFMGDDELDTIGIKGLLSWINKDVKEKLTKREFRRVASCVVVAESNGRVRDKVPYLKTSLKRAIEEKEAATAPL